MSFFNRFDPNIQAERGTGGLRSRYHDKTGIASHREWRGFADTAYDYWAWMKNLGTMAVFITKAPVRIVKGLLRYRWMGSYLSVFNFVDRSLEGYRSYELRIGHMHMHTIIKNVTEKLALLFKADERLGKNKYSHKLVGLDETMPPVFMAGFPHLYAMPIQTYPEFLICNMDQHLMPHYIDVMESFGVPADVCSRCEAEAGVAAEDDFPVFGACVITSNMPCDGSIMTSAFQARRFKKPTYPLMMPMRHSENEVHAYSEIQLKEAIEFIEKQTGETYDWKSLFKTAKILNRQNEIELEKWDIFKTPYSALSGEPQSLYRLFYWASNCGLSPNFLRTDEKVIKIMNACCKKKYKPFRGKSRHRAIIWSTAAVFYTDYPTWLQNCWGITVINNMDSTMGHNMINTEDPEKALADLALLSEKSTMRHHAVGGFENVNKLWEYYEFFNCDMVLFYDQLACKGMNGVHGIFEEEARRRNVNLVWIEHDLQDPRTVSRQSMREQMNHYMSTVMREEPLDATLVDFDDSMAL